MRNYRLSKLAQADLSGIRNYTRRERGEQQCAIYLHELRACFARLAEFPQMGTACDEVRPELRQWPHGRHVVFYLYKPYGVRIIRVLHDTMDPRRHEFTDEEDET